MILTITTHQGATAPFTVLESTQPQFHITHQGLQYMALDTHQSPLLSVKASTFVNPFSSLFIRWLVGAETRHNTFSITSPSGKGHMYLARKSPTKGRLAVSWGAHQLDCYRLGRGNTSHTIIHKDGTQIAEVARSLSALPTGGYWGTVFLLDAFKDLAPLLPIIAYINFSSGVDTRSNRHKGMGHRATSVSTHKTSGGYSSLYNPQWITQHFPQPAVQAMEQAIATQWEAAQGGL